MIIALLIALTGVTAECKEGMRDDPVLIIRAEKNHYIYFLPGEMELCSNYAIMFRQKQIKTVCGCKHLKDATEEGDLLRLRCAHWIDDKVYSKSVMWFYYYPGLIDECIRVRRKLMFGAKK